MAYMIIGGFPDGGGGGVVVVEDGTDDMVRDEKLNNLRDGRKSDERG